MSTVSPNMSLISLLQDRMRIGEARMSHWRDEQTPAHVGPAAPSLRGSVVEVHGVTPSSLEEEMSALQKTLSALSNELAYFRAHQARADNAARSPIQKRLPPELLSAIFLASDPDDQNFPTIVSHVSQHFRDIAFLTSALWSAIAIRPSTSPRRVLAWLKRSRTHPITFELRYAHHDDPRAVAASLNFLKPHLDRCARVVFAVAQWESARVVQHWFAQQASAAEGKGCHFLQHVQLSMTHSHFQGFDLSAILSTPYNIKSLHLGKLVLELETPSTECTSLEELCIANNLIDAAIPISKLLALLQKFPNLTSLTVKGRETITHREPDALARARQPLGDEEGERRVCLPSLTRLHLRFTAPQATAVLLSSLDLPNLSSASVELPIQEPAEKIFAAIASQPYILALTHLRVSGGSCGHLFNGTRLFSKLCKVQSVDLVGDLAELLCVCLGDQSTVMAPELRRVSLDIRRAGSAPDVLAALTTSLKRRLGLKTAAAHVESIRLSAPGSVDIDSLDLRWLQANVKDIEFMLDLGA